jgi:cytochrome c553
MLRNLIVLAACASLGLAGPAGATGDTDAGKAKAVKCAGCHGADGLGKKTGKTLNPPLAGMSIKVHVKAMEDYKTGARNHKVMQMLAKKLSDKEIVDLAAYYASLK